MLQSHLSGQALNKADHNRRLREKLRNRSAASVELKHQNISAVLERQGLPWLMGYVPKGNVQLLLKAMVNDFVFDHPDCFNKVPVHPKRSDAEGIFVDPPPARKLRETIRERRGSKIDFSERDARNRNLGKAGEKWVLDVIKGHLHSLGRDDLASAVRWVSDELGDGLGYDIDAFDQDGNRLLIEVKTTNGSISSPFLITANEVAVSAKEEEHYAIYRVFDFSREPKIYILKGAVASTCDLKPCLWQAAPRPL